MRKTYKNIILLIGLCGALFLGGKIFADDKTAIAKAESNTKITSSMETEVSQTAVTSYLVHFSNGETIIGSQEVIYGTTPQFMVYDEVEEGYEFLGWKDGPGENATVITDKTGRMLSPWMYNSYITVYPSIGYKEYNVTYISNGGSEVSSDIFTMVESLELSPSSRSGYRFMGWYEDVGCVEKKITKIPIGTKENKTVYAKWAKLYIVSFDSKAGSDCEDIEGIIGEAIELPTSILFYYSGVWQHNGIDYNFGADYVITNKDVQFTAKWTPIEYPICYRIFGKIYTAPSDKRTYNAVGDKAFWAGPAPSDSVWYEFDGWYQDVSFSAKKYNTADFKQMKGFSMGDTIYLEGRWRYVRAEQFTVTDSGVFNQSSDWISFQKITGYSLSQLIEQGYKTITFTGNLTAWQKDDGYKYMQVYDGTGSNATRIGEWWIDHRDGKTKRVYQLNNDGTWTFDLEALNSETLCFRYTASGTFSDTWYNSDFWLAIQSLNK